jgi:hypothetical protein
MTEDGLLRTPREAKQTFPLDPDASTVTLSLSTLIYSNNVCKDRDRDLKVDTARALTHSRANNTRVAFMKIHIGKSLAPVTSSITNHIPNHI